VCILKTVVAMSTTTSGPFHWKTEKEKKKEDVLRPDCVWPGQSRNGLFAWASHTHTHKTGPSIIIIII
jgi:nicotinamide riboside transporter PnuC